MTITGQSLIGAASVSGIDGFFQGVNARTGEALEPKFGSANANDLERACALAEAAFDRYRETSLEARAAFLETIGQQIESIGDALIERCMAETGLPRARLEGERARTIGQLKLFANLLRQGDYVDARIDPAQPERKPMPRVDLRLRNIALGPVAVFGASNFPLAFSVAGGDTASALAAGCPVVVKAHGAHPGTSELVGRAIQRAVAQCGLPEGVFSLLFDGGIAIGQALVADRRIKAVGFTGSRAAGVALMKIANARAEPVPVYAEMSAINPVVLLPQALAARRSASNSPRRSRWARGSSARIRVWCWRCKATRCARSNRPRVRRWPTPPRKRCLRPASTQTIAVACSVWKPRRRSKNWRAVRRADHMTLRPRCSQRPRKTSLRTRRCTKRSSVRHR